MKRPNILFILSDDQGAWAMRCAGNTDVITPNLDALAASGLRFDNFYCESPVCSPARASIMTGMMPSRHGVLDWLRGGNVDNAKLGALAGTRGYCDETTAIEYLSGMTCYTDLLSRVGYTCSLSGKWHMGDSMTPQHGFSDWFTITRGGGDYNKPHVVDGGAARVGERYITDMITDRALEYIDRYAGSEAPFYISVHYTAPHSPWEREQHPAKFWDMYEDCQFTATPDLPPHPNQAPSAPCGTGEKRKALLRGYYSAITAMDDGIGRLLAALDEKSLRDDTLVIFSGDNGMNMGHHGVWGKGNGTFPMNMFDTSVKVPFIVSRPSSIPMGREIHSPHSHYDVIHTLSDYLSLGWSDASLPGRSFAGVLESGEDDPYAPIVVYDEYGFTRMARTREWKLVKRYPYGPDELYDMLNDPGENVNLIEDERYKEQRERLAAHLNDWFYRYADPAVDGTREAITGAGQYHRPGIYSGGRPAFRSYEELGIGKK